MNKVTFWLAWSILTLTNVLVIGLMYSDKSTTPMFKTALVESEFQVWAAKAAYAESKGGDVEEVWLEAAFAFRDSSNCRDFIYFAEDYALAARFAVKQME